MTAQERSGAGMTDPAARPAPLGWLRAAFADREALRSWTLVANDGIIATAGILEGFAGAGASNGTLVTAATTATIAGMLTVGGAEWAEAAAEREAQLTAAEEEAADIARQPSVEHAELVAYYEAKGLTPHLARDVADQLMARNALDAQLESQHGILEVTSRAETVRAGVGSAFAFVLGAAIPLTVTLVVPVAVESSLILAAVVVSLTRTLVRTLTVGLATMAISYLVGKLVF
jgi:vacuolar iron transporter family protein